MSSFLPITDVSPDTDLMLSIAQSSMRSAMARLVARTNTEPEPTED